MSDTITCPVKGTEIHPGGGIPVMDSKGNVWIVSPEAAAEGVRADANPLAGPTLHGHPPIAGPDA